jgi:hypothetical protein
MKEPLSSENKPIWKRKKKTKEKTPSLAGEKWNETIFFFSAFQVTLIFDLT